MRSAVGWGAAWAAASLLVTGCLGAGTLGDAPPNARCGATPRLLVSANSYPVTPGATQVYVSAIVVEGSDVYYVLHDDGADVDYGELIVEPVETGAVMRVPAGGGQPVQVADGYLFAPPAFTSTTVILGEANVVNGGASGGAIVSIPRDGSPPTTLVELATNDWLVDFGRPPLVTDGTFVYYVDQLGVEVVPTSPASAGAKPTLLSSESPISIGIVGQRLLLFTSGAVESIPLGSSDAATETTLATGLPDGAVEVAACGNNACWLDEPFSVLEEIDPAGGPVKTIANLSGQFQSTGNVVFDGTTFFIEGTYAEEVSTGLGTMAIARVPGDGGPSVRLVTVPETYGGGALAVDDACVYFASSAGIFSLAKSAEGAVVQ
jgi:hypothetical protein